MTKSRLVHRPRLVLFDVDGTLLITGGAGKRAMIAAFRDVFGIENGFANVHMYGRTDPEIVRHALSNHGIEWQDEQVEVFKRRYFELIVPEMESPLQTKITMPGIPEVLDQLKEVPGMTLGILTGNWRESAQVKLSYFHLDRYFEVGAFADDSEVRAELLPFAVWRYHQKTGNSVAPRDVYVVGDTPRDVQCARPHGATTVAVATAWYSLKELAEENPDYLFEDFSDSDAFLSIFS